MPTPSEGPLSRVERSRTLTDWGERVRPLVERAVGSGGRRDLLTGRWLGHPAHPMIVFAPLSCWSGALLLDLVGGRGARPGARRLVGLGVLTAVPAAASGAADWLHTSGAEQRVGTAHALLNNAAVGCFGLSWRARHRGRHAVGVLWALAGAAIGGTAAYLGGHLTYARGVGVNTTAFEAGPTEWTDVASVEDLAIGGPAVITAGAVALVVVRQGDRFSVLEDRCTHRGGPLHEGTVDDACIRCPWHGSAFALTDGDVVEGPATRAQPSYETRVIDGRLHLRRHEEGALRVNTVTPAGLGTSRDGS
ncbi:MAG: Rieske 2Fe-2S domain-containing protein [Acidimicrobiales bacterium]